MDIKQDILEYVRKYNHVTFAEMSKRIDGFNGDLVYLDKDKNIIFWTKMSKEAIDALIELMKEEMILPYSTSEWTYMVDGLCLDIPIAKSWRAYKNDHWLPLVFSNPGTHS